MLFNSKESQQQKSYKKLCKILQKLDLKFEAIDKHMLVRIRFSTNDLPVEVFTSVDSQNRFCITSILPFKLNENRIAEMSVAVCAASNNFTIGTFALDMQSEKVIFSVAHTLIGGSLSEKLVDILIGITARTVSEYDDKFYALNSGNLSLEDFLKE